MQAEKRYRTAALQFGLSAFNQSQEITIIKGNCLRHFAGSSCSAQSLFIIVKGSGTLDMYHSREMRAWLHAPFVWCTDDVMFPIRNDCTMAQQMVQKRIHDLAGSCSVKHINASDAFHPVLQRLRFYQEVVVLKESLLSPVLGRRSDFLQDRLAPININDDQLQQFLSGTCTPRHPSNPRSGHLRLDAEQSVVSVALRSTHPLLPSMSSIAPAKSHCVPEECLTIALRIPADEHWRRSFRP